MIPVQLALTNLPRVSPHVSIVQTFPHHLRVQQVLVRVHALMGTTLIILSGVANLVPRIQVVWHAKLTMVSTATLSSVMHVTSTTTWLEVTAALDPLVHLALSTRNRQVERLTHAHVFQATQAIPIVYHLVIQ